MSQRSSWTIRIRSSAPPTRPFAPCRAPESLELSHLMFWWLKPLCDRVPLYILSRELFGQTTTVKDAVRAVPQLWRGWLAQALIFYRLDFARSFNLPVWQLEGIEKVAHGDEHEQQRKGHGEPGTVDPPGVNLHQQEPQIDCFTFRARPNDRGDTLKLHDVDRPARSSQSPPSTAPLRQGI